RDDFVGDLARITSSTRRIERDRTVKALGSGRRGRTRQRNRRRCQYRSWRCGRASIPITRLVQYGLCVELLACGLRAHQQAGVAISDGDVLPVTQTTIALCSLVVAFRIRERILLTGQQGAAGADRAEQHRGVFETWQVEIAPEVIDELLNSDVIAAPQ